MFCIYVRLSCHTIAATQSLGDTETIESYNQSRKMYCDLSLDKIWFLTELFIWWFIHCVQFSFLKSFLISNEIFTKVSDVWRLLSYFFVLGSAWYLSVHPAEFSYHSQSVSLMPPLCKNYQVSQRKIFKIFHFSSKPSSPHQGTETGLFWLYRKTRR